MLNFFVSFLLLELTAKITKKEAKTNRIIFASCLGAAYSLIIFWDDIPELLAILFKIISCFFIVLCAFKFHRISQYIKSVLVFLFSSIIFLGVIIALCFLLKLKFIAVNNSVVYFDLSAAAIITCAFVAYVLACLIIRLYDRVLSKRDVYTLTITYKNNSVTVLAFLDTGNNLYEPFSHSPVIVVDKSKVSFTPEKIRYIPTSTVNGVNMLPAFKPDKILLKSSNGEEIIENAYVAMSDDMKNENFSALFNYNILSV